MADEHGPWGGPGHFGPPPGGFGPMGPMGHLYAHGHYGMFAQPGPIRGVAGYANGLPGTGIDNVTIFGTLKTSVKYAVKKNGILKGFCIGIANFITDPASTLRYLTVKSMTNRAYQEKRLTQEQYDYRMIKNEERLLYRNLKRDYITEEQYNKSMDSLEKQYPTR